MARTSTKFSLGDTVSVVVDGETRTYVIEDKVFTDYSLPCPEKKWWKEEELTLITKSLPAPTSSKKRKGKKEEVSTAENIETDENVSSEEKREIEALNEEYTEKRKNEEMKKIDENLVNAMSKVDEEASEIADFLNEQEEEEKEEQPVTENLGNILELVQQSQEEEIETSSEPLDQAEIEALLDSLEKNADTEVVNVTSKEDKPIAEFSIRLATPEEKNEDGLVTVSLSSLISLVSVPIKYAYLAHRDLKPDHVENLKHAYIDGAQIPPIEVVLTSWGALVVSGNHRWAALEEMTKEVTEPDKLQQVRTTAGIEVKPLDILNHVDIVKYAFDANSTNGLSLDESCKSKHALFLIQEAKARGEKMSKRKAGRLAHVSHAAISKMAAKLAAKEKKNVSEFLSEEADILETETEIADKANASSIDKFDTAVKQLFTAMHKIVEIEDNVHTLADVFQQKQVLKTDEKQHEWDIIRFALGEYLTKLQTKK
jgi:hypothetical protein